MSNKEPFRGPVLGFLCSERPDDLSALDAEQHLSAFLSWAVAQLRAEEAPSGTTVFLEGAGNGLVQAPPNTAVLFRCGADEIAAQFEDHSFPITIVLFIGTPAFLRRAATVMMAKLSPPMDEKYDDVRPEFDTEVRRLVHQAESLRPGEVCRFGPFYLDARRFAKTHMTMILMHYLHHGRQFAGTEAAIATLPLVNRLSPTWLSPRE